MELYWDACLLKPLAKPRANLPEMNMWIMHQLYTLTTIVLVLQTIYYDHLVSWWVGEQVDLFPEVS